jgi:hypothetical protein
MNDHARLRRKERRLIERDIPTCTESPRADRSASYETGSRLDNRDAKEQGKDALMVHLSGNRVKSNLQAQNVLDFRASAHHLGGDSGSYDRGDLRSLRRGRCTHSGVHLPNIAGTIRVSQFAARAPKKPVPSQILNPLNQYQNRFRSATPTPQPHHLGSGRPESSRRSL